MNEEDKLIFSCKTVIKIINNSQCNINNTVDILKRLLKIEIDRCSRGGLILDNLKIELVVKVGKTS